MNRFSDDDKTLLYIIKTTANDLGVGSWSHYTNIFNQLASRGRSQDGLTAAYRSLDKSKMKARACDAAWDEKREQVRNALTRKERRPLENLISRFHQLDSEGNAEVVCPVPRKALQLSLHEWSGANALADLGSCTPFLPQQSGLSEEQVWRTDNYVSDDMLWPAPATECSFASSTATGLNVDNQPTYGNDGSAMYNAEGWAGCAADASSLYGTAGSAMYGDSGLATYRENLYPYGDILYGDGDGSTTYTTGANMYEAGSHMYEAGSHMYEAGSHMYEAGSHMYEAGSHMYEAGSHMYEAGSHMYRDGSTTYGTGANMSGTSTTYMNEAGNSDMFAADSIAETTIRSGPVPLLNTATESYDATVPTSAMTTIPTTTLDDQSYYIPNSSVADMSICIEGCLVDYEAMLTDASSQSSSFTQAVPNHTHTQGSNAGSKSIASTVTSEDMGSVMSSEELSLLLERSKPFFPI